MTVGELKEFISRFPDSTELRVSPDVYNRDCLSMRYAGWDGRVGATVLYVEVKK